MKRVALALAVVLADLIASARSNDSFGQVINHRSDTILGQRRPDTPPERLEGYARR